MFLECVVSCQILMLKIHFGLLGQFHAKPTLYFTISYLNMLTLNKNEPWSNFQSMLSSPSQASVRSSHEWKGIQIQWESVTLHRNSEQRLQRNHLPEVCSLQHCCRCSFLCIIRRIIRTCTLNQECDSS